MFWWKDTQNQIGFLKKNLQYAAYKRPTLRWRHTKIESERMEKDVSCKQEGQETGSSNNHIIQNRL